MCLIDGSVVDQGYSATESGLLKDHNSSFRVGRVRACSFEATSDSYHDELLHSLRGVSVCMPRDALLCQRGSEIREKLYILLCKQSLTVCILISALV